MHHWYNWHSGDRAHETLIIKAFRQGSAQKGNRSVRVTTPYSYRERASFITGVERIFTGTIIFSLYGTDVFGLDMMEGLVTNFGYGNFSITTSENIVGFHNSLTRLLPDYYPFLSRINKWCNEPGLQQKAPPRITPRRERYLVLHDRFRKSAPWCVNVKHDWWFRWSCFNEDQDAAFSESLIDLNQAQK